MKFLTKPELVEAANDVVPGNIKDLSLDDVRLLMTVTQFVTDLCINELEERDELTFYRDRPCIPYCSDHMMETILTRGRANSA
jgi:nitrate reductase assembly molybdenum cofactor insertion protein NarJ